ncbi:MAG: LVIVD repeat-containing protein [Actinomycetota bacterium]
MNKRAILSAIIALGCIVVPLTTRAAAGPTDVAGVPAAYVGVNGPVSDYASGALQLISHTDLSSSQTSGVPLGNNGAIALIGNCAFVGRWHDYGDTSSSTVPGPKVQYPVQIVDISNPAAPSVVGTVPDSTVHDAVAREIRAIDLPPSTRFPSGFQMLTVQTFGKYIDEYNEIQGQNGLLYYVFPNGDCTHPVPAGHYYPQIRTDVPANALRPHEFYQWLDPNPAHDVPADNTNHIPAHPRILDYVTTPLGGVDGFVVDASSPASPSLLGVWDGGQPYASAWESNLVGGVPVGAGRYTHSISLSPDGTKAYVSQWDGGFFTLDASTFAQAKPKGALLPLGAQSIPLFALTAPGNAHSAVAIPGTNDIVGGDEIYVTTDGCPFGWMHIFDQGNQTTPPSEIAQFRLPENQANQCSGVFAGDRNSAGQKVDGTFTMHNQTVTDRYVLTSWYGGGLRAIDISNPASPQEAGFFVPKPVATTASIPDTTAPIYGAGTDSSSAPWWVSTWSYPIIRNGYIYVSDVRNGLYILQATAGSDLANDLAKYKFLEGNSNLGDFVN